MVDSSTAALEIQRAGQNQVTSSEQVGDPWQVLAALRFVLASCVVITHSGIVAPDSFVFRRLGGQTGYAAVFCFFMISGYSIAASITARRDGYFVRRIRRIYPTLLVALAACIGLGMLGPMVLPMGQVLPPPSAQIILGNLFLVQSIFVESPAQDGALWSLSIEWWLYMLAPLLIVIHNRYVVMLGGLSFLLLCIWGHRHPIPPSPASHVNLLIISWAWLFGFAYFRQRTALTFLLLLAPPLVMFDIFIHQDYSPLVIAITVVAISHGPKISIQSHRLKRCMDWLGNASYPLYVLHVPLLFGLAAFTPLRNGNLLVAFVISTILLAYLLTTLIWGQIARRLAGSRVSQVAAEYRLRPGVILKSE